MTAAITFALALTLLASTATTVAQSPSGPDQASSAKKKKKKKKKKRPVAPPGSPGGNAPAPPPPTISVADASTAYPALASHPITFQVSLSAPSAVPVGVSYSTGASGDTAVAGQDYVASTDTLVIPPGSTTAPIPVEALQAAANPNAGGGAEPAESFTLTLSSPSNATLADGQATGTITTDDESPCSDEGPQPPPGIDSGGSFFANLCVGDMGDNYSIHLSSGEGITVTVVPQNADDDPEISAPPGASSIVVGGSAGGPGATDSLTFYSPITSNSFTLSVVHGDDHNPARAEGYYIYAYDYSP